MYHGERQGKDQDYTISGKPIDNASDLPSVKTSVQDSEIYIVNSSTQVELTPLATQLASIGLHSNRFAKKYPTDQRRTIVINVQDAMLKTIPTKMLHLCKSIPAFVFPYCLPAIEEDNRKLRAAEGDDLSQESHEARFEKDNGSISEIWSSVGPNWCV